MSGYWKLDSDMVTEVTTVIIVVMGEKLSKNVVLAITATAELPVQSYSRLG